MFILVHQHWVFINTTSFKDQYQTNRKVIVLQYIDIDSCNNSKSRIKSITFL